MQDSIGHPQVPGGELLYAVIILEFWDPNWIAPTSLNSISFSFHCKPLWWYDEAVSSVDFSFQGCLQKLQNSLEKPVRFTHCTNVTGVNFFVPHWKLNIGTMWLFSQVACTPPVMALHPTSGVRHTLWNFLHWLGCNVTLLISSGFPLVRAHPPAIQIVRQPNRRRIVADRGTEGVRQTLVWLHKGLFWPVM